MPPPASGAQLRSGTSAKHRWLGKLTRRYTKLAGEAPALYLGDRCYVRSATRAEQSVHQGGGWASALLFTRCYSCHLEAWTNG